MMYLLNSIYPWTLASMNMGTGWLLYYLFESVFGGLLVVVGLLVILSLVGGTVRENISVLRKSA